MGTVLPVTHHIIYVYGVLNKRACVRVIKLAMIIAGQGQGSPVEARTNTVEY